jgi:DNA-binding NtrC family response regulator
MINEPQGDSEPSPGSKTNWCGGLRLDLLPDYEVEAIKPLLRLIVGGIDQILDNWYEIYASYFDSIDNIPSLSEPEFIAIFKPYLCEGLNALASGRTNDHSTLIGHLGEVLAERNVPFAEVLLSLRTYGDSVLSEVPRSILSPELLRMFSKLGDSMLAVMSERYFRSRSIRGGRGPSLNPARGAVPGENNGPINTIVGSSPAMGLLRRHIAAAAQVRGTVLLVGESGTGKELVASAIHQTSSTPDTPFIAVNCAAIPKDLIESELFGYQRGAFSGANAHFLGLFRSAEKGTLFLDEVTEMSPETQSKILRAIQERTVRPLGSTREIAIDVRLIASANRDPEEAVRSGQLREDLYYRLQASVVQLPPLRERIEDIPALVEHFIRLLNSRMGRPFPVEGIAHEALKAMLEYPWPGNVRELSNAIEMAMTFGRRPLIGIEDLPPAVVRRSGPAIVEAELPELNENGSQPLAFSQFTTLEASERELVTRALTITGGNKTRAAKLLQISRKKTLLSDQQVPAADAAGKQVIERLKAAAGN